MMPSGWMPDARHDLRMRSAFDPRYESKHRTMKHEPRHVDAHRTAHRVRRRPRVIAHG
jgi:hypothetical protein